jgi:hypothetical protein
MKLNGIIICERKWVCVGGMFKLGSFVDPSNRNAPRDNQTGTEFTTTCHESYIRTETRIG